jgi:anti-sigma-K factor RskA
VSPLSLDALRELAPGYVMNTLTIEERAQFDAALSDPAMAAELRPELEAHRAALTFLASDVAVTPPPALRARLSERIAMERIESMRLDETVEVVIPPRPMDRASADPVSTPSVTDGVLPLRPPAPAAPTPVAPTSSRAPWMTAGILTFALAATAFFAVNVQQRVRELERTVASQQAVIDGTSARLAARDSTVEALTDQDLVRVRLVANVSAGPSMQVFWNRRTGRAVVHAAGLAPVAKDRAYCLWIIRSGKPEAVALFNPDANGSRLLNGVAVPADAANIAAFAVTEEPATGSPQPTMTPFLVGAVPTGAGPQ